ncbi:TIGR02300 family protein [Pontixanthobacter aquaemixtae]|uniref:TIGR02300 family protein n=1 Tax=Pontixanthobacter aquaemixtae TaxID=1958940 RepID=A0A844ZRN5_9SPHN|nr:TIGR02300 family protein [Pontixanthobacter aquaemixtae]MXO90515.1 TIGR02300 family protein [Pontixanthobacter aquaemixtae]
MVKPEWGTKRTCPKCGTRFYDLGKDEPATCIECGEEWEPEPVLKTKQPIPFDDEKKKGDADSDLADEDDELSDVDEDENRPDADVDLGDDSDDLAVSKGKGDDDGNDDT